VLARERSQNLSLAHFRLQAGSYNSFCHPEQLLAATLFFPDWHDIEHRLLREAIIDTAAQFL
jgi:tRNA G46 methylase TrmB